MNRRVNIAAKSRPEPTESVDNRPWGWASRLALDPFGLWFGPTWSTCHKHFCSDTIFGRIPNVLVISLNTPIWHLCSRNRIDTRIVELG
jgi:hypothetical protein